jgi:hypothetical protein
MRYLWLVALTGGLLALSRCGDPEGPAVAGSPFFAATIDGTAWVPDTASCLVISTSIGTAAAITASRFVSAQEEQGITILFTGFPAPGQFPLVNISGPATAFFSVYRLNGIVRDRPLQYSSGSAQPGLLSITGVSNTDSLITGTFSFEGATIPDSTPHHVLTGRFRLRYEVVQVP